MFADIASPTTIGNVRVNPFIEINIVDPFIRRGYRFKGRGAICESGPEFDFVAEDLWKREGRQYPVNAVVKVTIEKVLSVRSPAYLFNHNIEEEAIRAVG